MSCENVPLLQSGDPKLTECDESTRFPGLSAPTSKVPICTFEIIM
eukprot:SAG31_NODE_1583_length_7828_cov_1.884332_3_plen_45_part_00